MTKYGKQGISPNPLQRFLVTRQVISWLLLSIVFTTPFPIYLLFRGFPVAATVTFVVSFSLGMSILFVAAPRMTNEEAWDTVVPHLPWPKSWPGWRDPADLLAEETARRQKRDSYGDRKDG